MEFEGKITHVGLVETIGENATPKQTVVVEEVEKEYPSSVVVDFWRDKTELLANVKVGDMVKVHLNSRAREYNGRWYMSTSCWRMEVLTGSAGSAAPKTEPVDDDLPF